MKEPHHKQPYQTGFYFFWKWQYYLRHQYAKHNKDNKSTIDFEKYLANYHENTKYKKTSDQILVEYINGKLKIENLLTSSPIWLRRGYHLVDLQYKDSILYANINTKKIDIKRNKKGILDEIEGILDLIIEEQEGECLVPEHPLSIGHEKYWRNAANGKVKKLKLNFSSRVIGLWIWEHTICKDCKIITVMDRLREKHPDIMEIEDRKNEEKENHRNKEIHHELDKYKKYLYQTQKSIKDIEVLPL